MPADLKMWIVIFGGGILTYLLRLSFIAFVPADRLPRAIRRALGFVPPAVLAGIAFPTLIIHEGRPLLTLSNHQLLAGAIAFVVGVFGRNPWVTIASGLLALWILSIL